MYLFAGLRLIHQVELKDFNLLIESLGIQREGNYKLIEYKVENISITDDEKSYVVDMTVEMEDIDFDSDPVYITLSFSLVNDSSDLDIIKEKAVIKGKNILKRVLLEDAQQELF